jgi:hypothetical protein
MNYHKLIRFLYSDKKDKSIKRHLARLFRNNNDIRSDKGVINFIDVGSIGTLPDPWNSNAKL